MDHSNAACPNVKRQKSHKIASIWCSPFAHQCHKQEPWSKTWQPGECAGKSRGYREVCEPAYCERKGSQGMPAVCAMSPQKRCMNWSPQKRTESKAPSVWRGHRKRQKEQCETQSPESLGCIASVVHIAMAAFAGVQFQWPHSR